MSEVDIIAAALQKGFEISPEKAQVEAGNLLEHMREPREKGLPLIRQNNDPKSRNDFEYIKSFEDIVKACEEGCWVGYKSICVAYIFLMKRST